MKRKLVLSSRFERNYKKIALKSPILKKNIDRTILLLGEDAFSPQLNTHKLSGKLSHLHSCNCGFDCRIIFQVLNEGEKEILLLVDFGTHDEVY